MLDCDLERGPLGGELATARIEPLTVLTDHDEVEALWPHPGKWTPNSRQQPYRSHIDVLVELSAKPQQDLLLENSRRNIGVADGPEQYGIGPPEQLQVGTGERLLGLEISRPADVMALVLDFESKHSGRMVDDLGCLGSDLGSGAITGNDRNPMRSH